MARPRLQTALALGAVEPLVHEDVGNLVGGAVDVAGHEFSRCFSGSKDDAGRGTSDPASGRKAVLGESRVFHSQRCGKLVFIGRTAVKCETSGGQLWTARSKNAKSLYLIIEC